MVPLSAVTRSEGTPVATWSAEPPTIRPPKRYAETIVQSGLSPPNSATTIPLNPPEPVKPVRLPSVTIRWEMLPNTRIAPARPHIAPLRVIARVIVRLTGIPAYADAFRESPTARIWNPKLVRHSRTYTQIATTTAIGTPRWSWVPLRRMGSWAAAGSTLVSGIRPPVEVGEVSTSGPARR